MTENSGLGLSQTELRDNVKCCLKQVVPSA